VAARKLDISEFFLKLYGYVLLMVRKKKIMKLGLGYGATVAPYCPSTVGYT